MKNYIFMNPHNTDEHGKPFDPEVVKAVWEKAIAIGNGSEFRRDVSGMTIRLKDYGDTSALYGWEVDHIKPVTKGGKSTLANLQPLFWYVNRMKGDTYPWNRTILRLAI